MKKKNINIVIWLIRIVVASLFIFSALSKFCPWPCNGIFIFETKYIGSLGIEGMLAKVITRLLIGLELSLGMLILMPFYLKRIVIPFTIIVLSGFSIHLIIQIMNGSIGNCGCFGECISMTPKLALFKNILSVLLLVLIYRLIEFDKKNNKLLPIITIFLTSIILVFIFLLKCEGGNSSSMNSEITTNSSEISNCSLSQILLYLDPNCDHCEEMLKEIVEMKNNQVKLPEILIIFGNNYAPDTEQFVKEFFERVGQKFNYNIVSNDKWNDLFFADYNTPGLKYIYNGEQLLFFEGEGDNKFNKLRLKELLLK